METTTETKFKFLQFLAAIPFDKAETHEEASSYFTAKYGRLHDHFDMLIESDPVRNQFKIYQAEK